MQAPVEQLAAMGHVGDALSQIRRLSSLSTELRALQAELEALAGHREEAFAIASEVGARREPPGAVARALVVTGQLHFFFGRSSEGHQHFARAREAATRSPDAQVAAAVLGRSLEVVMRYVGLEAVLTDLGTYKRASLRAGRPHSLAAMHRVLAEAELKAGHSHRALRELELCELHVGQGADLVAKAQLCIARSAALGLLGDLAGAHDSASEAIALVDRSGALSLMQLAQLNLAHCQLMRGQHSSAATVLDRLIAQGPISVDRTLDIRGSQLALATALGDELLADAIDTEFGPIARSRPSVKAQWYNLATVGYLVRFGRAHSAASIGLSCLSQTAQADKHYLARVQAATAEALILTDAPTDAVALLSQVVTGSQGHLPEFIAATQRVSGRLAHDTPTAAFELFARAARIFGHIGHLVGRGESLHNAAELRGRLAAPGSLDSVVPHITTLYTKPAPSFGRIDVWTEASPATTPDAVASAVRASAALVDLASRPVLAGYELLSLTAASGTSAAAVILSRAGDTAEIIGWEGTDTPDRGLRTPGNDCVTFELGRDGDRDVSVVVRPRNQHSARTTLLAMQRLVTHGIVMHRAAVAESEKSAIWPEPLPEQQLGFVCVSESMLDLLRVTRRVAASTITVLITGETGTGKELLARAIHNCSPRAKKTFIPFNCTAVPRDLLDAQLFGHRRGAFTGAHDASPGVIRSAAGGTLFLDEIGEIGMDLQPKLLRFLESSDVHPLGEPTPVSVDVRIVAATNANLDALVQQGRFRDDLYYRLNVVKLTIPPLRERREEIPLLLDHFLERSQKDGNKTGIRIGETAAEFLLLYDWPGNVRELANEMRRAVALAESGAVLMPEHLSPRLAASRRTVPVGQRPPTPTELLVRRDQPLTAAVEHVERALIQDALRVHGNVEDAARALGLSRKGLYLKRQRLKIDEV